MIDDKINRSLKELEQGLKNVESARKQVEKTVNAYDGLNSTTTEYVNKLSIIATKVQDIVDSIGKDYAQKVESFEKDRDAIIKTSNDVTEKLSNATYEFRNTLSEVKTKLKYIIIINAVSFVAIITILILFLK